MENPDFQSPLIRYVWHINAERVRVAIEKFDAYRRDGGTETLEAFVEDWLVKRVTRPPKFKPPRRSKRERYRLHQTRPHDLIAK